MTVQIVDTPEKFQPMAQELVPPLVELLRARNDLELETHRRFQALEAEKPALGLPKHQIHPTTPPCGRTAGRSARWKTASAARPPGTQSTMFSG